MTRFETGRWLVSSGANALLSPSQAKALIVRHAAGDWGLVCSEDAEANERALIDGSRILSSYELMGVRFWVITEADRSATTVLLPGEY